MPAALQTSRYPPANRRIRLSSRRTEAAKTAAAGASDGSIIAAIIVAQTPANQPTEPSAVPGPASIPVIRSAVDHHANPAAASTAATIASSLRIAVNGERGTIAMAQAPSYSSWRRHQMPVSLRPSGARSSHEYMPQTPSTPRP